MILSYACIVYYVITNMMKKQVNDLSTEVAALKNKPVQGRSQDFQKVVLYASCFFMMITGKKGDMK